jgi:hypothetical protein
MPAGTPVVAPRLLARLHAMPRQASDGPSHRAAPSRQATSRHDWHPPAYARADSSDVAHGPFPCMLELLQPQRAARLRAQQRGLPSNRASRATASERIQIGQRQFEASVYHQSTPRLSPRPGFHGQRPSPLSGPSQAIAGMPYVQPGSTAASWHLQLTPCSWPFARSVHWHVSHARAAPLRRLYSSFEVWLKGAPAGAFFARGWILRPLLYHAPSQKCLGVLLARPIGLFTVRQCVGVRADLTRRCPARR